MTTKTADMIHNESPEGRQLWWLAFCTHLRRNVKDQSLRVEYIQQVLQERGPAPEAFEKDIRELLSRTP